MEPDERNGEFFMDVKRILSEIDTEIARLQQIRSALTGIGGTAPVSRPGPGRPKGSGKGAKARKAVEAKPVAAKAKKTARKRRLSPEGRKRIAEAMKRRWAERRKEASK